MTVPLMGDIRNRFASAGARGGVQVVASCHTQEATQTRGLTCVCALGHHYLPKTLRTQCTWSFSGNDRNKTKQYGYHCWLVKN